MVPVLHILQVRSMGGVATPLAGAPPPTVSSPGRYSGLTTPLYSHAPSTTYNPGYQPSRRYLRNVVSRDLLVLDFPLDPNPNKYTGTLSDQGTLTDN
jgi:hypothetical protein